MTIRNYLCAGAAFLCLTGCDNQPTTNGSSKPAVEKRVAINSSEGRETPGNPVKDVVANATKEALPVYVDKGVEWLVKAQHPDGGWGAGSHANQSEINPHAVQADPATTAFAAIALMRAGNTFDDGLYTKSLRKATEYMLTAVEKAPNKPGLITDLTGTQIQSKLGPMIDTSMALQFLSRALLTIKQDDPLVERMKKAADVCIAKLQESQAKDGSWNNGGGWAPVLQSSMSCSALEYAKSSKFKIDAKALDRARDYQKGNCSAENKAPDPTGKSVPSAAASGNAGVELYSFAGAQRGNAADTRRAKELWQQAKDEGKVAKNEEISAEKIALVAPKDDAEVLSKAVGQSKAQEARLNDERLLAGFGNNGGEEYLSYLLTGESLVIEGGDKWEKWMVPMADRLKKVQNPDGSWSGHHCISSAVFCTAAVVQCATVNRDHMLQKVIADNSDLKKK